MKPAKRKLPPLLPLSGEHPNGRTWHAFITKECELRDTVDGVLYYGASNCNYLVFPNGCIVENFGYHGWATMNRIRERGWPDVLLDVLLRLQSIRSLLKSLGKGRY